jgi:hypothetical protein
MNPQGLTAAYFIGAAMIAGGMFALYGPPVAFIAFGILLVLFVLFMAVGEFIEKT